MWMHTKTYRSKGIYSRNKYRRSLFPIVYFAAAAAAAAMFFMLNL